MTEMRQGGTNDQNYVIPTPEFIASKTGDGYS